MKTSTMKMKKKIQVNVRATEGKVKIKYPNQVLGNIWIELDNGKMLGQWEVTIHNGEGVRITKIGGVS